MDAINGTIACHDNDLRQQAVVLEAYRHDLAAIQAQCQRCNLLVASHEAILHESHGAWRAVAVVSASVSLAVTTLSVLLTNRLFPPR